MKLDEYNRLRAIVRCPSYIEEYNEIGNLFYEVKAERDPDRRKAAEIRFNEADKRLCRKWNLILPISATRMTDKESSKQIDAIHERKAIDGWTEEDAPTFPRESYCNALSYNPLLGTSAKDVREYGYVYIRLRIDLNKTDGELKKSFIEMINFLRECSSLPKIKKPRKTIYNPWDVYDLHAGGLGWLKIASELWPQDASPTFGTDTARHDVEQAYNRAVEMIQFVESKYNPSKKSI